MATNGDLAPFVIRLTLAIVMFPHGAQKVLGWFGGQGLTGTINAFTQYLHIPLVFVLLAIAAEFLGPIGLLFGLLTRVAAFGIGIEMIVAAYMNHVKNGFFMNWSGKQAGEGFEYHVLVVGICIALMIAGAGRWSVDRQLADRQR
jgi:putative oxidoreductase